MIEYIKGTLAEKEGAHAVIESTGIGYRVYITMRTFQELPETGQETTLYTHDYVREDTHALYGFLSVFERDVFSILLGVSGVGPKMGMKILNEVPPQQLINLIASGDDTALTKVKGVGAKLAGKLVLELKNKMSELKTADTDILSDTASSDIMKMTKAALKNLGYKESEIKSVVEAVFSTEDITSLEDAVKKTLIVLGK
jgi:Holliday junction DNA helicase RuvA